MSSLVSACVFILYMTTQEARTFIARFAKGKHSQKEHESFLEWVRASSMDHIQSIAQDYESLYEEWELSGRPSAQWVAQLEDRLDRLETVPSVVPMTPVRRVMPKLGWAAAILVLLGAGAWYFFFNSTTNKVGQPDQAQTTTPAKTGIVPGGNKAILTLADGSMIVLNEVVDGAITQQGNTTVSKKNNKLEYLPATTHQQQALIYNTVNTPRGGQYQLTLPDQTRIWLNAESSIRFPVAFTGNERRVEITGEVYFEVTENQSMPFKAVIASDLKSGAAGRGRGEVEVVGTHFNIMAYDNEPSIQTTLLKGSVKVAKGAATRLLKPGQQATISNEPSGNDNIKVSTMPNPEDLVVWKDGYFTEGNAASVMHQVARWYDVDIAYAGKIPDIQLEGKLSRDSKIESVLRLLDANGIRTELQENERKIIVKE